MAEVRPVTLAICGAGSRGAGFAGYAARNPDLAKVVAVAEPRDFQREQVRQAHGVPPENVFRTWEEMLSRPRLADAIVIGTTDRLHRDPAVKAAELGYHILLEKPMAPTVEDCLAIVDAVLKHRVILGVCHVLRYATFYEKIKEILDSGRIGRLVGIQHMEGVAWWHFAHSFVRGNFRNEATSSFMLLAKCCHDIDVLRWWVGRPCRSVASTGSLVHFRPECRPPGAADRCLDCPLADERCPYSAKKFYFDRLHRGHHGWPLAMLVNEYTDEALTQALREGPYGRCVYASDNDAVDHQDVTLEFDGQVFATLTMTAFSPHGRKVRIMGTHGYIEGEEQMIRVLDFQTEVWTEYDVNRLATDITGGHGGGDPRLMRAFLLAVRENDPAKIATGPQVTLESHLIVFAAERARRERRVVELRELYAGRENLRTAAG